MRRIPLVVVLLAILGVAGSAGGGIPIPPPPGDQLPTWSPDGSVIVFLSDRDGTSLRVMNPDGSDEHQIPWLPASASYSFSHDWTHVAAVVNGQLVVERLDGSDRVTLGPATYLAKASWSPDGTRVTYTAPSANPNEADVLVARIDGTETHRVATGFYPTWSPPPTADRIAYVAGPYGKNELHVVDADGTRDIRLASGGVDYAPSWSSNDLWLAMIHEDPGKLGSTLQVVGVDGRRVAAFHVTPNDYAWSPNGGILAYSNSRGVWTVDVEYGHKHRVSTTGSASAGTAAASTASTSSSGNRSGSRTAAGSSAPPVTTCSRAPPSPTCSSARPATTRSWPWRAPTGAATRSAEERETTCSSARMRVTRSRAAPVLTSCAAERAQIS